MATPSSTCIKTKDPTKEIVGIVKRILKKHKLIILSEMNAELNDLKTFVDNKYLKSLGLIE